MFVQSTTLSCAEEDAAQQSTIQVEGFTERTQLFAAEVKKQRAPEEIETICLKESKTEEDKAREKIIETAKSLIGNVRYDYGGKASHMGAEISWGDFDTGLDCSGFVQWVYWTSGYPKELYENLLSTTSIRNSLETISYEELQIGDLGLFGEDRIINHVGIYAGDGLWVHCNATAKTVSVDSVNFTVYKRVPVEKYMENLYSENEIEIRETTE